MIAGNGFVIAAQKISTRCYDFTIIIGILVDRSLVVIWFLKAFVKQVMKWNFVND